MEEDIKILEKYINGKDTMKESLVQAIQSLIVRYKELEEEKEKAYKEGYIKGIQPQIFENWNKSNAKIIKIESQFISKSKVKEKIEELNDKDLEIYDTDSEDVIIAKYEERAVLDFCNSILED